MSPPTELDYVEEHGPGIPELPAGPPIAQDEPEQPVDERALPGWEQETIEQFLRGTGAGLHMLAGVGERDWLMTQADLERIAPPLTRIANRYEPALRLSPIADPLLVAHGFALYGWRSALERKRAQRDGEEAEPRGDGYERVEASEEGDLEGEESAASQNGAAPYFPESPLAEPGGETIV
jgi:hypothetical protein